jgi:hypothetical protein
MKKVLSLFVVFVALSVFAQVAIAKSPTSVAYYDARGVRVYGDDLYQTDEGWLYFGRNCFYLDRYGNKVSANNRRVFYYDIYGNFVAGKQVQTYAYQRNYYDSYGNLISATPIYYYYDIYGNLIATSAYDYRYGGYSNYRYDYYYSVY